MRKPLFTLLSYLVPSGHSSEAEIWYEVSTSTRASIPMKGDLIKLLRQNNLITNPQALPYELLHTAKFTWPRGSEPLQTKIPYDFMVDFLGRQRMRQILAFLKMEHSDYIELSILSLDTFLTYIQGIASGNGLVDRYRSIQVYFSCYRESEKAHGSIQGDTVFHFSNSLCKYIQSTFREITPQEANIVATQYGEVFYLLHTATLEKQAKQKKSD